MSSGQGQSRLQKVLQALQIPGQRLSQPTLVLLCGLPGTGKSYLAQQLAGRLPFVVVSSDRVRRLLFDQPAYSQQENYAVHSTCQEVTADLLRRGHSVVLDATNLLHRHRQRYYSMAEECGAQLLIVQTTADPQVVQQRLQERQAGAIPAHGSSADWAVYVDYADKTEPIRRPHRVVDTSEDVATAVEEMARQLEGAPAPLTPYPRARFILNPAAGQSYRLADLEETLGFLARQGWELSLRETSRPREAMQIAHQAAEDGLDIVVAVGGDGTVNEVVNGLAHSPTALAVLPMGSGNSWAREQGLEMDPLAAARALAQGQVRYADLGQAGTRYFLLMASIGFDAAVLQTLSGEAKQTLWPMGYVLKGVSAAIDFAGEETVVTLDDEQITGETVLIVIGNTRLYGGLAHVTPNASIDDGLLDVCIFHGKGGLPQISLFALVAVFQRPDIVSGVDLYRAREVVVSSQTPLHVQTDGDPVGMTPMTFRAVPGALRVLVPRDIPAGLFTRSL